VSLIIDYIENISRPSQSMEAGDTIKIVYDDGSTEEKVYTDPSSVPENVASPIRQLSKRAFMQRFTQAERIAIRNSTDDVVIDIHEDLKMSSYVDLDDASVSQALAYFVSQTILSSDRPTQILSDGFLAEAY